MAMLNNQMVAPIFKNDSSIFKYILAILAINGGVPCLWGKPRSVQKWSKMPSPCWDRLRSLGWCPYPTPLSKVWNPRTYEHNFYWSNTIDPTGFLYEVSKWDPPVAGQRFPWDLPTPGRSRLRSASASSDPASRLQWGGRLCLGQAGHNRS